MSSGLEIIGSTLDDTALLKTAADVGFQNFIISAVEAFAAVAHPKLRAVLELLFSVALGGGFLEMQCDGS